MSAALSAHPDLSLSNNSQPELSLGSLASFSTTPGRPGLRVPSTSSRTTAQSSAPVSTPPQSASAFSSFGLGAGAGGGAGAAGGGGGGATRRKPEDAITSLSSRLNMLGRRERDEDGEEEGGGGGVDVLDTPGPGSERKRWGDVPEASTTTGPSSSVASKRTTKGGAGSSGKGVTLTLRDQEKHIDNLKKENFNIKLRVHFLEERLAQLAPDQIDAALKQNINLKIEVQQRGMEIKKLKKLVLSLEHELERSQRTGGSGGGGTSNRERERELEEKLEEREMELRELRAQRRKAGQQAGVDEEVVRELEARNAELEDELDNAKGLIEDNMDEIERLKELVERRGSEEPADSEASLNESRRGRMARRLEELENDNEDLRAKLSETTDLLTQREEEKEDLLDEIDALRLTIEDLEQRLSLSTLSRSSSRAQVLTAQEEREAVEEDLNAMKDRMAALMIELQGKEEEVEERGREIEELVREHKKIVQVVEEEWRGEVEEARGQVEELRDVLAEREAESKDLRVHISELESNTNELHTKFESALTHLEAESTQKDTELEHLHSQLLSLQHTLADLESTNDDLQSTVHTLQEKFLSVREENEELVEAKERLQETIDRLGEQIYELEDENDRVREELEGVERERGERDVREEEERAERERLEVLCAALKEKIASLTEDLQRTTDLYETCSQEIHAHRTRQEELATHIADLVADLTRERTSKDRLAADLDALEKEHDATIRAHKRTLEAKESALQSALADLARTQSLLGQREEDLKAVQQALQGVEEESKRAGERDTTARFSLQLECDRLKRDLERVEDELRRVRKELDDREAKHRERDSALDKLHSENRDLSAQLASQTQARLNLSEKLDAVQASLRTAETELGVYKTKVGELEARLSKDQRALLGAEAQYRDQLTERNTLLLTIYQYLDKILGVDKTPKKGTQAETKPFTNFSVFHDNLITRLKALSAIQTEFEKRCKEVEGRFAEKLGEMRKQLEGRWKQIDKFEASVKQYAETKAQWKRKYAQKEGELEAVKATNAELASQLTSIKRPGEGASMEVRALAARAANAERRLNNAQNQLLSTEEKIAQINQKNAAADSKWEARVKEYEARLKAAEERVKRERQGGKERVVELENSIKSLQRQLELAQKRNNQLNDVVENAKGSGSNSPAVR